MQEEYMKNKNRKSQFGMKNFKESFTQMLMEEKKTVEEIKLEYGIYDNEIALRLLKIKVAVKDIKHNDMSNDELISFLKNIMNYDDMQTWLMRKQMEGVELTLNDELKKFFELKSNEDILKLYDIEQNYDQININRIRKVLEKNQ